MLPILLNIKHITNIAQYLHNITHITHITNVTNFTDITDITTSSRVHYFKQSRLLLDITQYYQYHSVLPILQIHWICGSGNSHQCYRMLHLQYYSILHWWYSISILLNMTSIITYSMLLNIPNPQNCVFPFQYISIFFNIMIQVQAISNIH